MKPDIPITIVGMGLPPCATGGESIALNPVFLLPVVQQAEVLVAGKQYLALVANNAAEKLAITADLNHLFATLAIRREQGKRIVILASGDPLFYGIANTAIAYFGAHLCQCIPHISSLQAVASITGTPVHALSSVSLHGRDGWKELGCALVAGNPLVVLCDAKHTPMSVAQFCLERGHEHWNCCVFQDMCINAHGICQSAVAIDMMPVAEFVQKEAVLVSSANAASLSSLQCMLLRPLSRGALCIPTLGIADALFMRENDLMTKSPVRAAGLSALSIAPHHCVWDLGAGSGAVGIEASRLAYRGQVFAVEQHAHRLAHITQNRRQFGAANMEIIAGDALEQAGLLPQPDRVFIGGGLGGKAEYCNALLESVWNRLPLQGRLVAHCVLLHSLERVRHVLAKLRATVEITQIQTNHSVPLGQDLRLESANPVWLVCAIKDEE